MHTDFIGNFVLFLAVKYCENQLRFDKVTVTGLSGPVFLGDTVYIHSAAAVRFDAIIRFYSLNFIAITFA